MKVKKKKYKRMRKNKLVEKRKKTKMIRIGKSK